MTTNQIRSEVVDALRLDLIGPDNDHAFAHELHPDSPSQWYLTGFLVPRNEPEEQRTDRCSALVTSANFTSAAQRRNIELGMLIRHPSLAKRIADYFEGLCVSGTLARCPFSP